MQWKEPEVIVIDVRYSEKGSCIHYGTDMVAFGWISAPPEYVELVGDPVRLAEQHIKCRIEAGSPPSAFKVFIMDVDKGGYMPHELTITTHVVLKKVVNVEILRGGK